MTAWSVILNRMDMPSKPWKECRIGAVAVSAGAADAGKVPLLGADGTIDTTMVNYTIVDIDCGGF